VKDGEPTVMEVGDSGSHLEAVPAARSHVDGCEDLTKVGVGMAVGDDEYRCIELADGGFCGTSEEELLEAVVAGGADDR
jgi:hypothetical protein